MTDWTKAATSLLHARRGWLDISETHVRGSTTLTSWRVLQRYISLSHGTVGDIWQAETNQHSAAYRRRDRQTQPLTVSTDSTAHLTIYIHSRLLTYILLSTRYCRQCQLVVVDSLTSKLTFRARAHIYEIHGRQVISLHAGTARHHHVSLTITSHTWSFGINCTNKFYSKITLKRNLYHKNLHGFQCGSIVNETTTGNHFRNVNLLNV